MYLDDPLRSLYRAACKRIVYFKKRLTSQNIALCSLPLSIKCHQIGKSQMHHFSEAYVNLSVSI